MADYCVMLKDANPGALRSPPWRSWPAPRSATVALQHFGLACSLQAKIPHVFKDLGPCADRAGSCDLCAVHLWHRFHAWAHRRWRCWIM